MRDIFSGYRGTGTRRPEAIALSAIGIDETAGPGTVVGDLSVAGGGSWTYRLADDAGAMFAISGARLVVGATQLDGVRTPQPSILAAASSDNSATAGLFVISVRPVTPDGMQRITGADGALLTGADGAFLIGKAA